MPGGYRPHKSTYTHLDMVEVVGPAGAPTCNQMFFFTSAAPCAKTWVVADATAANWLFLARPPTPCKSTKSRLPDTEITKGRHSLHLLFLKYRVNRNFCKNHWNECSSRITQYFPNLRPFLEFSDSIPIEMVLIIHCLCIKKDGEIDHFHWVPKPRPRGRVQQRWKNSVAVSTSR